MYEPKCRNRTETRMFGYNYTRRDRLTNTAVRAQEKWMKTQRDAFSALVTQMTKLLEPADGNKSEFVNEKRVLRNRLACLQLVLGKSADAEILLEQYVKQFDFPSSSPRPGASSSKASSAGSDAGGRRERPARPCKSVHLLCTIESFKSHLDDIRSCEDTSSLKKIVEVTLKAVKEPLTELMGAAKSAITDLKAAMKESSTDKTSKKAVPKSGAADAKAGAAAVGDKDIVGRRVPLAAVAGSRAGSKGVLWDQAVDMATPVVSYTQQRLEQSVGGPPVQDFSKPFEVQMDPDSCASSDKELKQYIAGFRDKFDSRKGGTGRAQKNIPEESHAFKIIVAEMKKIVRDECVLAATDIKSQAHVADFEALLKPIVFGIKAGTEGVASEKHNLAALRLTVEGHRQVILVRAQVIIDDMKLKGFAQPFTRSSVWGHFNEGSIVSFKKWCGAGGVVFLANAQRGTCLYVPAGFLVAEKIQRAQNLIGIKVGLALRHEYHQASDYTGLTEVFSEGDSSQAPGIFKALLEADANLEIEAAFIDGRSIGRSIDGRTDRSISRSVVRKKEEHFCLLGL